MNRFEELFLANLPINDDVELAERQTQCDSLRKKFRREIAGALTFGSAETLVGLYMVLQQGGMNPVDAWCLIFSHVVLIAGTMRNTRNAIHTNDRINSIRRKIEQYRASDTQTD
jgi:hypothetical protein